MRTFSTWLEWVIGEARRSDIDPGVLAGYERAFKDEVKKVISRTQNPALRSKLEQMLDCPIRDSRGQCRAFSDYIVSALIKNGIHHRYDLESALGYVFEKMTMPTTDTGEPRTTVFGGFEERPGDSPDFNPLQARFLRYLQFAIQNIRRGKIARLAHAGQWPQGTLSIAQGRARKDEPVVGISPDELAAPRSGEADLGEMIEDITALLTKKEGAYGFPLVGLFHAIMAGMNLDQQRKTFGDRKVRPARQAVMDTIENYAKSTNNHALLNLLQRLRSGEDRDEAHARRTAPKTPKPVLPEKERDYRSIADVVARFSRPVGSADLGKYRRRWLDYPARIPGSGFRNRLEEVLAAMVRDGVLKAKQTTAGATVYEAGPAFEQYRQGVEAGV